MDAISTKSTTEKTVKNTLVPVDKAGKTLRHCKENDDWSLPSSSNHNPSEFANLAVSNNTSHSSKLINEVENASTRTDELEIQSVMAGGVSQAENITTRERIRQSAEQIVEEVNQKRQGDSQMINDYKSGQITQVENFCNRIESHLFQVYKVQNQEMQDKLQKIFEALDRIAKLETELQEFRQVLNNLYKDIMTS